MFSLYQGLNQGSSDLETDEIPMCYCASLIEEELLIYLMCFITKMIIQLLSDQGSTFKIGQLSNVTRPIFGFFLDSKYGKDL